MNGICDNMQAVYCGCGSTQGCKYEREGSPAFLLLPIGWFKEAGTASLWTISLSAKDSSQDLTAL